MIDHNYFARARIGINDLPSYLVAFQTGDVVGIYRPINLDDDIAATLKAGASLKAEFKTSGQENVSVTLTTIGLNSAAK